jgi:hypothetical protein
MARRNSFGCLAALALILVLASFFTVSANAVVINADWKVAGDGLAMLDVTNNKEWLDLTQTVDMTYDYVSSQFGVGGVFEGWRYATQDELNAMFTSAGVPNVGNWDAANVPAVTSLLSL